MKQFEQERNLSFRDPEKLPEHEEALFSVLVPEIRSRAISMDDFASLYTEEGVRRDKEELERLKKKFAADGKPESLKKSGKLFEAVMYKGIEDVGFLGPDATCIIASEYDDVKNGIDSIVEFEGERGAVSHVALGIDITKNRVDLSNKFGRIKRSIDSGTLSSAKYFTSKNIRGELKSVSRVIVGADEHMMDDISHLILRDIRLQETKRSFRENKDVLESLKEHTLKEIEETRTALGDHPLQWIVLYEMRDQLTVFRDYAEQNGKSAIAEEYGKILGIVGDVIKEKEDMLREEGRGIDGEVIDRDEVYRLVKDELARFGQ